MFIAHRHVYKRQDEYRAWVKNVAPMENVMRESQKVIMLYKHNIYSKFLITE